MLERASANEPATDDDDDGNGGEGYNSRLPPKF